MNNKTATIMKLKEGTKVKCIRNTYDGFKPTTKIAIAYTYLTVGKTYDVLADFGPTLAIITDNGYGKWESKWRRRGWRSNAIQKREKNFQTKNGE